MADKFRVSRGAVQMLASAAASYSYMLERFSKDIEDLWPWCTLLDATRERLMLCINRCEPMRIIESSCLGIGSLVDAVKKIEQKIDQHELAAAKVSGRYRMIYSSVEVFV